MRGLQDVFPISVPVATLLIVGTLTAILLTAAGCRRNQVRLTERDRIYELRHEGRDREYILHRPGIAPDSRNPRPLLIVMHGGGGKPRSMIDITRGRFNELADAEDFYVVYPGGFDKSWNDGRVDVRATAHREKIDDVGFLERVIDSVAAEVPVDRSRIFATGISNGGFMSMRLACQLSGVVRAVAVVTAQLSQDLRPACRPDHPVGVLLINGTEDPIVPYEGGTVELFWTRRGEILSTDDTLRFWARHNRCSGGAPGVVELPDRDPDDGTRVDRLRYAGCAAGRAVQLLRVRGGGHTWPGGAPYLTERIVGRVSYDVNASDEIWKFFRSQ